MRNLKTLIVLTCALTGQMSWSQNEGGQSVGNGGDRLVINFKSTARNLAESLKMIESTGARCFPLTADALSEKINSPSTIVTSKPMIFEQGSERDAWNDGANQIWISRNRLITASEARPYLTLVLHEYFGLLGVESSDQSNHSQSCMDALERSRIDLNKLVYQERLMSSVEKDLISRKSFLECSDERASQYRLYSAAYFAATQTYSHGYMERVQSGGRTEILMLSGSKFSIREEYSTQTGGTTLRLTQRLIVARFIGIPSIEIFLSSTDHITWTGTFNTKNRRLIKEFGGSSVKVSCTPIYR